MISVIVPVYNAEKYIKQTVEAIQNAGPIKSWRFLCQ